MVRSLLWSCTVPLSPVYGECRSRLKEGVCPFDDPPREPGCWAFHESVGAWPRFHDDRQMKAVSSPVALICTKHAAVLSAWERSLRYISAPFWGSLTLEKKQPQPPGTRLTSSGRLTGAVARLCGQRCLPSRGPCPICGPARRVCKDHFTCIS